MKLTIEQTVKLQRAMELLEAADGRIQSALGEASEDLHNSIEEICADIEMLLEEAELVDSLDI